MQATEEGRDREMSISAQGYHDIHQDSDFHFHSTVFAGVLPQPKSFLILCKPKLTMSLTVPNMYNFVSF
jgi:hypothetical protein